jgi:hypothetical protein
VLPSRTSIPSSRWCVRHKAAPPLSPATQTPAGGPESHLSPQAEKGPIVFSARPARRASVAAAPMSRRIVPGFWTGTVNGARFRGVAPHLSYTVCHLLPHHLSAAPWISTTGAGGGDPVQLRIYPRTESAPPDALPSDARSRGADRLGNSTSPKVKLPGPERNVPSLKPRDGHPGPATSTARASLSLPHIARISARVAHHRYRCARNFAASSIPSRVSPAYPPMSWSATCGSMFACARTAIPALTRIWFRVNSIVSNAMFASRILLSDAAAFSS